jgi:hypothetical protein
MGPASIHAYAPQHPDTPLRQPRAFFPAGGQSLPHAHRQAVGELVAVTPPRLLLSCVSEDRTIFHRRVENLVSSARCLGGALASSAIVVNMVDGADSAFVRRMEALDAEVRIVPRITDGGVAQANKLRMLELHERTDYDILLAVDCDIAVAADPAPHLSGDAISVVPADMDPFTDSQWRRIFEGLALERPEPSVQASTTGRSMYPYFNSGAIGVPRAMCAALFANWMQALKDLDELWRRQPNLIPRRRRFFTEQLGLAVALWRGLPWVVASRELNFATHVALHGPTVEGLRPSLLHYHSDADEDGFLFRPRCPVAEPAADRVNRSRAEALDLTYECLRARPVLTTVTSSIHHLASRLIPI